MSQNKEQKTTLQKEQNKMKTSNLPDTKIKTLIIRILSELRGRIGELSKNFNKEMGNINMEIENIKKNAQKRKNTITEMKDTLERIKSRLDEPEDQSSIWKTQ